MSSSGKAFSDEALQAYVDNQIDPATREEIEAYLGEHPEKARELEDFRRYNLGLHLLYDPVLSESIPQSMTQTQQPGRRRIWSLARAASILLAVGVGLVSGWVIRGEIPAPRSEILLTTDTLVRDAFSYHVVYTPEVRHPVEVTADQQQHLFNWLSKRLKTPVRAPNLETMGYQLLGGRLLETGNEPAAQFMYENDQGRRATLFTRHRLDSEQETAFRFASQEDINGFYWIDRDLSFVLIADSSRDDLSRLAHYVYEGLNE